MKKIIVIGLGVMLLVSALPTRAQTTNTTIQAQLQLIQQLLTQIRQLQEQINELRRKQQETASQLITTLKEGDRGELVEELQSILAAEGVFNFPRITGVFGPVTRRGVIEFKRKHNLPETGVVDELTIKKLRARFDEKKTEIAIEFDVSGRKKPCITPGHLIAPGQLKKGGPGPSLEPCKNPLPPGILKLLGQGGPGGHATTSTTTPPMPPPPPPADVTPPVITNVTAASTTSTSTHITWTTNEPATSKVFYSTSTPVVATSTTPMVISLLLVTSHDLLIDGLSASTTYHFIVSSTDGVGNTAMSTESMFITP